MPDDGEAALQALSEIGHQRRLLDEAELTAVRAARRAQKSWAEIATKLGITRQTAWEKWRDLDEDAKGLIVVPDVVGLNFDHARDVLHDAGLTVEHADPDAAPLAAGDWSLYVVVRQYPEAWVHLHQGSWVRVWTERGGGEAGVREPRRPVPPLREATAELDIESVVGE